MLGAIIGDIAGSRFEFNNMFDYGFELFSDRCSYTDDTICTVAVADAILNGKSYKNSMLMWCLKYPYPMGGYGSMFARWICSTHPEPYGSFGNGAAMRVSPVGWLFNTEEEVVAQARATAEITHDHPEGIRGAVTVALGIFLMRTGVDFETVLEKSVAAQYGQGWQEGLPAKGKFDGSCQGCVPLAFHILGESSDFEDAIRRAVSYGGDCDTVGAIVGSLAEARWPVPEWMRPRALSYLPSDMQTIIEKFDFYKICLASNEKNKKPNENKTVMTREELIKQCRYYNGGENPFKKEYDDDFHRAKETLETYWDIEKEWVEKGGGFCVYIDLDGKSKNCEEWEYYNRLGGGKYPGIPDSLLSYFCHYFFKDCYSFKDTMEEFHKEMEGSYLEVPSHHYPKDQIPSGDNSIK